MSEPNCKKKWDEKQQSCVCAESGSQIKVQKVEVRKPVLYLTFDDGPDLGGGTEIVLRALTAAGLDGKAVFFLTGTVGGSRKNSDSKTQAIYSKKGNENDGLAVLIREILRKRHGLANHGLVHQQVPDPKKDRKDAILREAEGDVKIESNQDNMSQNEAFFRDVYPDTALVQLFGAEPVAWLRSFGYLDSLVNEVGQNLDYFTMCRLPGGASLTGGAYRGPWLGYHHVGWNQEFTVQGKRGLRPFAAGKIANVASDPFHDLTAMMNDACNMGGHVALLHDADWRKHETELTSLLKLLAAHFECKLLRPTIQHDLLTWNHVPLPESLRKSSWGAA